MNPDISNIIQDYMRVKQWRNIRIVSTRWQVQVARKYYGSFPTLTAALEKRNEVRARLGMKAIKEEDTQVHVFLAKTPKCVTRIGNKYQLKVKGKYIKTFDNCREAVLHRNEILRS